MKLLRKNISKDREGWLKSRKGLIGSSEIATCAGLNAYESPFELWCKWTGKIEAEDDDKNPVLKFGRMVEHIIQELFQDKNPHLQVENNDDMFVHPSLPWAIATPDSWVTCLDYDLVEPEENHEGTGLLEIKASIVSKGWDDGVPDYAHCQTIWQMGVCGLQWGYVAGLLRGNAADLRTIYIPFDQGIFDQLTELGAKFLEYVEKDIPPAAGPGDSKLIDEVVYRDEQKAIELAEEACELAEQFEAVDSVRRDLAKELKEHEATKRMLENNIKLLMGDAAAANIMGRYEIELKRTVRKAHPVAASEYTRFKLKRIK